MLVIIEISVQVRDGYPRKKVWIGGVWSELCSVFLLKLA